MEKKSLVFNDILFSHMYLQTVFSLVYSYLYIVMLKLLFLTGRIKIKRKNVTLEIFVPHIEAFP